MPPNPGAATDSSAEPDHVSAARVLGALGIDEDHLRKFADGQDARPGEQQALAELLAAVRRIPPPVVARFAAESGDFPWDELPRNAALHRGRFFGLGGHVTRVTEQRPTPELARRLELPRFYRCECELGNGSAPGNSRVVVWVVRVPLAWPTGREIRELVSFRGLYLKLSGGGPAGRGAPTFAASRLAWHPQCLLGDLGVDAGLLDGVRHNRDLDGRDLDGPSDREAFYQLLAGMSTLGPGQLESAAQQARGDLRDASGGAGQFSIPGIFEHAKLVDGLWREADGLRQLSALADRVLDLTGQKNAAKSDIERASVGDELKVAVDEFQAKAQAVRVPADVAAVLPDLEAWIQDRLAALRPKLVAAGKSPYAQGQPMAFEGTARRAVRVLVDDPALVQRFGFDHYFLVEAIVDLGQAAQLADGRMADDALVIAQVRELPDGMPQGEKINARVRLSGVFLKLYPYVPERAQRRGAGPSGANRADSDERRLAPLLIGRDLVWVRPDTAGHSELALIATGLFLLLLGVVVLWSWRTRRADARARAKRTGQRPTLG